jgi:CheY-like chemotaxis protein
VVDGASALSAIQSEADYDVLIFDNEMPGIEGLELIRRARRDPRRQQTPIIMLSASDIEKEAKRAGANVFLRKPEEITVITETIARLLARRPKQTEKGTNE